MSGHRSGVELERVGRLEKLFADHGQAVRAYALRRIDPVTADDVVSEVFVVAFRRLEEIPDEPLPWLLATTRRVLANQRRASGRREALTAQLTALHAGVWRDDVDGERELLAGLARCSERDREILLLVAWEDPRRPNDRPPTTAARRQPRPPLCTADDRERLEKA